MAKEKWQAGINICNSYHKPINNKHLLFGNRKIGKQYAQTVPEKWNANTLKHMNKRIRKMKIKTTLIYHSLPIR